MLLKCVLWGCTALVLGAVAIWAGFWSYGTFGVASHARVIATEAEDWIGHPFDSVQTKVDAIARALDENERLRLENAHLKLRVESLQFDAHQKKAQSLTHSFESKLHTVTGTRVGRTLASMSYHIPEQLSPEQLYVLGVSYFKAGENEKSAAILTFLTNLEGNARYRNPRDWLMTGVAWYRLDNYEQAGPYFDKVIKNAGKEEDTQSYHAQALLWKALVAERTGKRMKAQFWMRELLDHHPYSREAAWVNGRKPASAKKESSGSHEEHAPSHQ
jgi:tetratricopeptide (TPR) repeat protein